MDKLMNKPYVPTEAKEQEALADWARLAEQDMPELKLLFHIPMGGFRYKSTAVAMKRQLTKPGVPDLFLPVARCGYNGLFVELKRLSGGTISEAQKKWLAALNRQGYLALICRGWVEAAVTIEKYLKGEPIECTILTLTTTAPQQKSGGLNLRTSDKTPI
ncbi:MAG: VRR-NUC domain-containing protein [Oscillospiraceae bacterium]|jgi:hypothetical protein|nr:VRR-NUC domain-containing protein [Oscillospiraceae bacterium]